MSEINASFSCLNESDLTIFCGWSLVENAFFIGRNFSRVLIMIIDFK